MIAELGHFALILALCASLAMAMLPMAERITGQDAALRVQQRGSAWVLGLSLLACAALMWCFLVNDFSVRYVASHSHSTLAPGYRLAALWGSHEGSMLLWVTTLAAWMGGVAWRIRGLPVELGLRMMSVLGGITASLLLFVLLSSNPFARLLPAPLDGSDLNALLQDPGMAFHPPALYFGYVGFAVPFAFAVAAMWLGSLDKNWLAWLRPWILYAWAALGLGIVLGSSWAYRVLGWGGWWFWDPVENASLLPWLVGLALLHVVAASARTGMFKLAVLLLCIAAFGLSLIGTFIVRSGAITSVHAFATDPERGIFILALIGLSLGGSLWLFAMRAGRFGQPWTFAALSRESLLLCNALIFSVAAATVLLATLYPMALDAFGLAKISVGPPYFEAVLGPLLAPAVMLMGLAPLGKWKAMALPSLALRLRWALLASILAAAVALWLGHGQAMFAWGMLLGVWAVFTALQPLWQRSMPRGIAAWGMVCAHLGVGVFILALTTLKSQEVEREAPMSVGQTAQVGPYQLRLEALEAFEAGNHSGVRATVVVLDEGKPIASLHPESRNYTTQEMTVAAPDIDTSWRRDVYVAMGQSLGPTTWAMRLQFKPMMVWVWIGFLMMSAGGVLAAWRRLPKPAPHALDVPDIMPASAAVPALTEAAP
ncbi:MAG: c-type cytochrome biogenesis protein CcmF [Leptothrix sp. (in: Bacteria)]|nr:c-type cytochrome biogenesis protein CcmF [Leptothrix sp. (in: b-proteobacteria)]